MMSKMKSRLEGKTISGSQTIIALLQIRPVVDFQGFSRPPIASIDTWLQQRL
jgi:hypothetical protein